MVKYSFHVFLLSKLYFYLFLFFCCLCCAHILESIHDKLSSRATHCVFLSYSCIKGVLGVDTQSHHFYISIDIASLKLYHISGTLLNYLLNPQNFYRNQIHSSKNHLLVLHYICISKLDIFRFSISTNNFNCRSTFKCWLTNYIKER